MTNNLLKQISKCSLIAIDTIDDENISKYSPVIAMTNPSFIFSASSSPRFENLFKEAISLGDRNLGEIYDHICVLFAEKLLKSVPDKVSIQIDARLSYDKGEQVKRALRLIRFFNSKGISKDKIIISLVSTWEGIMAAHELETVYNIKCNLTLMFSLTQAAVCAKTGVYMVSTCVEGINEYYFQNRFQRTTQKGVDAAKSIYFFFKKHNLPTLITGSCFGSVDQIKHLSGCDYLSITPYLLSALSEKTPAPTQTIPNLTVEKAKKFDEAYLNNITINTKEEFENKLNDEKWASNKLSQGIMRYGEDIIKLENYIKEKFEY